MKSAVCVQPLLTKPQVSDTAGKHSVTIAGRVLAGNKSVLDRHASIFLSDTDEAFEFAITIIESLPALELAKPDRAKRLRDIAEIIDRGS